MKKIKVKIDSYPSDKDFYDLIVSQKFAKTKLQKFLKARGVICATDSIRHLADKICSMILDRKDFDEILSFLSVKENRNKTTIYQFPSTASLDEIGAAISGMELNPNHEDSKVKLDDKKLSVNINKVENFIKFEHGFYKSDFSKSAFLQKESHQFEYELKKTAENYYEITVKSTSPDAEEFVSQIHSTLKKIKKDENYIHEVLLADLREDEINQFFDQLLNAKDLHNLKFESADKVQLQLASVMLSSEGEDASEISPSAEALAEADDGDEDSGGKPNSLMKSLSVTGTNILKHPDIIDWREKGFSIRSVTGIFSMKGSSSTTLKVSVIVEFNGYGKFQSEVKSSWQILHDEKDKEQRYALSNGEKAPILNLINRAAFDVLDKIKGKRPKSKSSA